MDTNEKESQTKILFNFISMLNKLDNFYIEEGQQLNKPITFQQLSKVNSGNSCFHFVLIKNKHRIVIQTYKHMNHKQVDIVQGKIELETIFQEIINFINKNNISDSILNNIFISYYNIKDT